MVLYAFFDSSGPFNSFSILKFHQLISMLSLPLWQESWKRDAVAGHATGAFSPVATPCRLLSRADPSLTPPPVPVPYRKTQLTAAKRLEKDLKNSGSKANAKAAKAEQAAKGKKAKKAKEAKEAKKAKEAKPAKKPCQGPMAEAMGAFVTAAKAAGYSHIQSLRLWKLSPERAQIVEGMSESERKRRRY